MAARGCGGAPARGYARAAAARRGAARRGPAPGVGSGVAGAGAARGAEGSGAGAAGAWHMARKGDGSRARAETERGGLEVDNGGPSCNCLKVQGLHCKAKLTFKP
jgi:hypothetical protein